MIRCRSTILVAVFLACVPVAPGQPVAPEWAERLVRNVVALAFSLEEKHSGIYADVADGFRQDYPDTAKLLCGRSGSALGAEPVSEPCAIQPPVLEPCRHWPVQRGIYA